MLIGEVASKYDVSLRTLRYYEERGLIQSERNAQEIRSYDRQTLERLELIIILKNLGFGLKEIGDMMAGENHLRECLQDKMNQLSRDMRELKEKRQLIASILQTYGSQDLSRHSLRAFFSEQLYYSENQERLIKMKNEEAAVVVELGTDLLDLADFDRESSLLREIKKLRESYVTEGMGSFGLIRVKDNPEALAPKTYRVVKAGSLCAEKDCASLRPQSIVDEIIADLKLALV